jgi:hypothetical protein
VWLTASAGLAQDSTLLFPRPYDGFQAGAEAHAIGEAQRLDAIDRQIGWNQLFKWRAAVGTTTFYDPYVPGGFGWGWDDPFSSWPYSVGRIVGPGFLDPVRQPIGRREVQTGPNRWESFPVYADDLRPEVVVPASPLAPAPASPPARARSREF